MAQQQQVFVTIQSPAAVVTQPQTGTSAYKLAAGRITGMIQIACGTASIICGILTLILLSPFASVGWPFCGGIVSINYFELQVRLKSYSLLEDTQEIHN